MNNKIVVGYARVSTAKQVEHGRSLVTQRETIAAFCADNRLCLVRTLSDDGLSGRTLGRPGLQEALSTLSSGHATAIVVTTLDRLSRSASDVASLFRGKLRADDSLFVVDDAIDDHAEATSKRTRDTLAGMKARGEFCGGSVPYGFVINDDGKLESSEIEANMIRHVRAMRGSGLSLNAIAKDLTREGFPPRNGKVWHAQQIKRMLAENN